MKKTLLLLFVLCAPLFIMAQFSSDLVIYNPNGEAFKVYLGRDLINNYSATKVRINDIGPGDHMIKIVFNNPKIQKITQKVFIPNNTEVAMVLRKNRNGGYYTDVFDAIVYQDNSNSGHGGNGNNTGHGNDDYGNGHGGNGNNTGHGNDNYGNGGNGNDHGNNNGHGNDNYGHGGNGNNNNYDNNGNYGNGNGYNNNYSSGYCSYPMDDYTFGLAFKTITDEDFDNNKLTIAKQIASDNCLLAEQVKIIMGQFSFETNRLEFAKYAYLHCYDRNRYFIVNDSFEFSSSITKLNDYISTIK